jgi:hypothetical protein
VKKKTILGAATAIIVVGCIAGWHLIATERPGSPNSGISHLNIVRRPFSVHP